MYSFKFYYLEACDNLKISPNEKLLMKIEEGTNSISLNLSSIELNDSTCKAVGLAVSKDIFLQELDFSNCMLNDEGLSSILLGLEKNKCLLTLNLKGNNIRSYGTEALGKLLRHNNHLQNLYLEWNNTGIFPEKFSFLCEGLCVNKSVKSLDLRNNQLNHICAQSIADVISRNSTVQKLDLRWNNIGLIGGRTILKALTRNKSILKLDISGNDVPLEIQKSIELIISVTAERYLENNENIEKTKLFASMLQDIEMEQNRQLKSLMERLEKKDKDLSLNERWNSVKLTQLQEKLAEKDDAIENFSKKVQELQKKISFTVEEKNNIALALNEIEIKYKESKKEYKFLLEKEQKDKEDIERKLLEEIGSLKEENIFLKQQIQDLKMVQVSLEDQIMKLKSSVAKMEKMSKLEEQSFQEQISALNEKHQENLREIDLTRKNEIARIREEFGEAEKNLRERITLVEKKRADLEKQVFEKDAQIIESKARTEEMINELKRKMKSDEDELRKQMEDRINLLESSNKKQDELLKEQLKMMHEIKTKCTENDLLLAEEAHRAQHLQQCLEAKDTEMEASIAKVKLEVKEQLELLNSVQIQLNDACTENSSMKQKVKEIELQHTEEIKKKDKEMEILHLEVEKQKSKIKEILLNENKRIKDLQTAFASYVNSAKLAMDLETINTEEKSAAAGN